MSQNKILKNTGTVQYELTYKSVKNINLRIKPDGTVCVSANRRVPKKVIEEFVLSKSGWIEKTIEEYERRLSQPLRPYFREDDIERVIRELCQKAYPYFQQKGIPYPVIRFREMVSRWGSCHPTKGILTFNKKLMYAPIHCIEYVVFHEFTHFLQPNHSKKFYEELTRICPNWKECRQQLKTISIR